MSNTIYIQSHIQYISIHSLIKITTVQSVELTQQNDVVVVILLNKLTRDLVTGLVKSIKLILPETTLRVLV